MRRPNERPVTAKGDNVIAMRDRLVWNGMDANLLRDSLFGRAFDPSLGDD
jgi:hypothetical protein